MVHVGADRSEGEKITTKKNKKSPIKLGKLLTEEDRDALKLGRAWGKEKEKVE